MAMYLQNSFGYLQFKILSYYMLIYTMFFSWCASGSSQSTQVEFMALEDGLHEVGKTSY